MSETTPVRPEDLYPVHSRISWGAILAGAVLALGANLVLTLLGGAIGLSVRDAVEARTLGVGAAIWAVLTILVSLFLGGWVASQLSTGETKGEAAIYGLIVWGVVFAMFMWMVGMSVGAGFSAMMGATQANVANWEVLARQQGVPQETINEWRAQAGDARAEGRVSREEAAEMTTAATWWTLVGTMISMAAAVGGAVLGAGPTFRVVPVGYVRTTHVTTRAPVGGHS